MNKIKACRGEATLNSRKNINAEEKSSTMFVDQYGFLVEVGEGVAELA